MAELPPLTLGAWFRHDFIIEHVAASPGPILELGAGQGAMGARMAQLGDYVGVEPDATSRSIATAAVGDAGTVVSDLSDVDRSDFAVVAAFEVLEHIEDDAEAMKEWVGRLRPGGSVIVSAPAFAHRFGPWDEHVGHLRRYDPDVMQRLLAGSGLVDVEVRVTGFPISYGLEALRNQIAKRRASDDSTAAKTAGSARLFQPKSGRLLELVSKPLRRVQRSFPERGTGLVAAGRLPL